MTDTKIKKMVAGALFAALTCVATMVIRIPTPGTGGYVHPGDALVILAGIFLGPGMGFFAAGIGSALADLIGGYAIYIPITFAVKGLVALLAGFAYNKLGRDRKKPWAGVIVGGIGDILLVAFGYFLPEILLYGLAGAVASLIPNAIQGVSGLAISLALYPVLSRAIGSSLYQRRSRMA